MARFAKNAADTQHKKVLKTKKIDVPTYNGAPGRLKDDKTALFTLAVTTLLKDKFYESGNQQLERLRTLTQGVTQADPQWVADFARWLRSTANIRSASIVVAAEYVKAGGPNGRAVVDSVLQRADEPAEMLGYWHNTYGRKLPAAIKRGVADATQRLYNEYAIQKYDGLSNDYRIGDVIQLVHSKPKAEWQSDLFKYALDRRYTGGDAVPSERLTQITKSKALDAALRAGTITVNDPSMAEYLKDAGWTWERLSGYGKMDAVAWEAVIPSMGYMALLRNLRNFDEAGIGKDSREFVKSVLADPDRVAKSRQFPYRFYTAFKSLNSVHYLEAIEEALELSIHNLPVFDGKTLVAVDSSGSMTSNGWWSSLTPKRGDITPAEKAAIFGVGLYLRNDADVVLFDSTAKQAKFNKGTTLLKGIESVVKACRGGATYLNTVQPYIKSHERVVVFTDMQVNADLHTDKFIHMVDLQGYDRAPQSTTGRKTFMYAGWTDSQLRSMPLLERGVTQVWPWETE